MTKYFDEVALNDCDSKDKNYDAMIDLMRNSDVSSDINRDLELYY